MWAMLSTTSLSALLRRVVLERVEENCLAGPDDEMEFFGFVGEIVDSASRVFCGMTLFTV